MRNTPTLYIFAGLPASGKSTIAKMLAKELQAAYFRIDTIEQGLRDLCNCEVYGEGYRLAYRIIRDNLNLGICTVADSCNTLELTRDEWNEVATSVGARFVDIEVVCSDKTEHRRRVDLRRNEIESLVLPTWQQVLDREYDKWTRDRIVVDTAGISESKAFETLLENLNSKGLTKRCTQSREAGGSLHE